MKNNTTSNPAVNANLNADKRENQLATLWSRARAENVSMRRKLASAQKTWARRGCPVMTQMRLFWKGVCIGIGNTFDIVMSMKNKEESLPEKAIGMRPHSQA